MNCTIMNPKRSRTRIAVTVLAFVLLAGCSLTACSQRAYAAEDNAPVVRVSNVDELLAAIAPNTIIELSAGEYDLSSASNYGGESRSPYYYWNSVSSGEERKTESELIIQNIDGLTLRGSGLEETRIVAVPRYADVIKFISCKNLMISNLTAGHTTEPSICSGGVLSFENCICTKIDACGLYGCGTIGVWAADCNDLTISASRIYECSHSAVNVRQCRNVHVEDCDIYRLGKREEVGIGTALFTTFSSDGFLVHDCRVYDNKSQFLLQSDHTKNTVFLSNEVHNNQFGQGVFQIEQHGTIVDGCGFTDNGTIHTWIQSSNAYVSDATGKLLDASDFDAMTLKEIDPNSVITSAPAVAVAEVSPGGSIEVTTTDEFLSAIGPDRTIVLAGDLFDLSSATNYGSIGGKYYYWEGRYDGPQLVIQNVSGLTIRSKAGSTAKTTVSAVPRYANVLSFHNCNDIMLADFTAGHTREPGTCAGGVLDLEGCNGVRLDGMRLYGCGILGIQSAKCSSLDILRTEIYECSQGAGEFYQCKGVRFLDCNIHDVPSPALSFTECGDKTWNKEPLEGLNNRYVVGEKGALFEIK